jgi:putative membrane protein
MPTTRMVALACVLAATAACRARPPTPASEPGPAPGAETLETLHQFDRHHVTLGQLAQERSDAITLTDFGAELVRDHQAIDAQVVELASARHLPLLIDTHAQEQRQHEAEAVADQLRVLDGPAFDRAFLPVVVQEHEKLAALVKEASQNQTDQQLSLLLAQVGPAVQRHLETARRLQAAAERPVPPPAAPVQARRRHVR